MFTSSIVLNEWRHYVFQYDGTKQIIYENGLKIDENTITLSLNTQQKFTIGAKFNNTGAFNGRLYDFRYYNRVLPQNQITDIYNNNTSYGDEVIQLYNTDVARTEGFSHANIAKFDGINYLSIPYTPTLNTPQFTVSIWVNAAKLAFG